MRDPITYTTGEVLLTALLIYATGYLAGRYRASTTQRHAQERRDAARRRYTHNNNNRRKHQ